VEFWLGLLFMAVMRDALFTLSGCYTMWYLPSTPLSSG